jgi:putative ABC transport system permease protein
MSVDRGFDARGVTLFETPLPGDRFPDEARRGAFAEAVLERIVALPGIEAAAAMSAAPILGNASGFFEIEGRPPWPRGAEPGISFQTASPGYAKTLGVKVQQGRFFDARDGFSSPHVAVINETMARRFFPGESPIGKRLRIDWGVEGHYEPGFNEIVGVYGDTRNRGLGLEPAPEALFPLAQHSDDGVTFAVRAGRGGADLLARLRRAVHEVDPLVPVTPIRYGPDRMTSYEQVVDRSVSEQRFYTFLLGAFAAVALVLAAVGVFGVVAYSVEQRRSELAIRLALGAPPRNVLLLVLRQSAALVAIGVAAGLAVAVVATRLLRSLVFGVSPLDLGAFSLAAALLVLVALVASYLPARRATRISPMLALRGD